MGRGHRSLRPHCQCWELRAEVFSSRDLQLGSGVQPKSSSREPISNRKAVNGTWEVAGGMDRTWGVRLTAMAIPGHVVFVSACLLASPPEVGSQQSSRWGGAPLRFASPRLCAPLRGACGCLGAGPCTDSAELWLL